MSPEALANYLLEGLNSEQQEAVLHGEDPLLLIAGAGTGKTRTLVHRVAHLIHRGVDPARILLLTFTRRAASEMLRRVDEVLHDSCQQGVLGGSALSRQVWGGTFHAVATRLLRRHAAAIGIDDLDNVTWGKPNAVGPDQVPAFWACGITAQAVACEIGIPEMITHKPGHMFVTDLAVVDPVR